MTQTGKVHFPKTSFSQVSRLNDRIGHERNFWFNEYVKHFIDINSDIPEEFSSKWNEIVKKLTEEGRQTSHYPTRQPKTETV